MLKFNQQSKTSINKSSIFVPTYTSEISRQDYQKSSLNNISIIEPESKHEIASHKMLSSYDSHYLKPRPLIRIPEIGDNYVPKKRKIEFKGGYDVQVLSRIGKDVDSLSPEFPLFQELGTVNIHAITLALKSQIPGEVRQALDKLALVSSNPSQNIFLKESPGLTHALGNLGLDLLDNLEQNKANDTVSTVKPLSSSEEEDDEDSDLISSVFNAYRHWETSDKDLIFHVDSMTGDPAVKNKNENAINRLEKIIQDDDTNFNNEMEITTNTINRSYFELEQQPFGFKSYIDLLEMSKNELDSLHSKDMSYFDIYWDNAVFDRIVCITMILRNLSFCDSNQALLVEESSIMKFIFNLIRYLANNSENMSIKRKQLNIQKDVITLLSQLGLHIILPTPADAFTILLLILSFSSEPDPFNGKKMSPSYNGCILFKEYDPSTDKYLPCAVDALAKIIPRDPPNRSYLKEVLLNTCQDEEYLNLLNRYLKGRTLHPYEFLTKTFAFTMSVIPRSDFSFIPKSLELRASLLQQTFLIADNLVSMIPKYGCFDDIILSFDVEKNSINPIAAVLELQKSFNVSYWWLESVESLGPVLLRATSALSSTNTSNYTATEMNPFLKITLKSISILRSLLQKSISFQSAISNDRISNDQLSNSAHNFPTVLKYPLGIFPSTEFLFGALLTDNMNDEIISQLCQFEEEYSAYYRSD
ncbi:uncharacterized protein SAPINGB_P005627 [Magnusiomyces paraingens]|uniref:Uncharacterized protein n=1 Tax=Magnusiomyces paraingens TaxID=2606893 RepID=A0A5E8C5M6_9ASCO|nr:uncharacterized protein SAPINGB_P005627 [Saprochaete ingens]VVT57271.1 unnamed protein product [Saprochaete ingens]